MDWNAAIETNREALKRILAALVAMAGLDAVTGGRAITLPRCLHRAVLRLLRPAESAARRLVIALAAELVAPPLNRYLPKPKPALTILRNGLGTGILMPRAWRAVPQVASPTLGLPLFDRIPGFTRRHPSALGVPRISAPGATEPFPVAPRHPPAPNDPVDARRLGLRLEALGRALDDLPRLARRFARWRVRRDLVREHGPVRRLWPLRGGRPPGLPRRPVHEVQDVLKHVHWLALQALERRDTS